MFDNEKYKNIKINKKIEDIKYKYIINILNV